MNLLFNLASVILLLSIYSTEAFNCTKSGTFCSNRQDDCNKVQICIPSSSNTWTSIEYDCEDGENCYDGQCTTDPNPNCVYEKTPFECTALSGMYPDPGSCKKFHICLGNDVESDVKQCDVNCEDGYGYNPETTYCDVTLNDNQCSKENQLVPVCKAVGETDALESNPVLYYICLPHQIDSSVLYPYIYMCPYGRRYIGNYLCSDDVETTPAPYVYNETYINNSSI